MRKLNLLSIKENFLNDDGFDRDIIDLARAMNIGVYQTKDRDADFIAITVINEKSRQIIVNNYKIRDNNMLKFICAYQLAEVIMLNKQDMCSIFKIEFIDAEIYKLAQEIFNRSNKYKKTRESINKRIRK